MCAFAPRISIASGGLPHGLFDCGPVVEVTAGYGVAGTKALDGALEADVSAGATRTRTEVDDVVGDHDRLRLVLDHEHGVALVAQAQQ